MNITKEYLKKNPNHIFVFGDNTIRAGLGGAAITKKYPDNRDKSFYTPKEYNMVFDVELKKLEIKIIDNQEKTYLISKLGSGLANRFGIWEEVIKDKLISTLSKYKNVKFLFDVNEE